MSFLWLYTIRDPLRTVSQPTFGLHTQHLKNQQVNTEKYRNSTLKKQKKQTPIGLDRDHRLDPSHPNPSVTHTHTLTHTYNVFCASPPEIKMPPWCRSPGAGSGNRAEWLVIFYNWLQGQMIECVNDFGNRVEYLIV